MAYYLIYTFISSFWVLLQLLQWLCGMVWDQAIVQNPGSEVIHLHYIALRFHESLFGKVIQSKWENETTNNNDRVNSH